jgi:hypothetical protein
MTDLDHGLPMIADFNIIAYNNTITKGVAVTVTPQTD